MTRAEALEHCGNSPFLDVITQRGSRFRLYRQTIESSDDGYVFGHRLERDTRRGGSEKSCFRLDREERWLRLRHLQPAAAVLS